MDKTLYLIFDMDWAPDPVIRHTVELLEQHRAAATFFLTHESSLVAELARLPWLELGLHPHFPLGYDDSLQTPAVRPSLESLRALAPAAVSVRCHALLNSTPLLEVFAAADFSHEVSCFVPPTAGMALRPWRLWNGLVRVPFCWEDDINGLYGDTTWDPAPYLALPGLKVLAFHPIHVYLNTGELADYARAKPYLKDPERLAGMRRADGRAGASRFLRDLLRLAGERGFDFGLVRDIAPEGEG